MAEEQKDFMHLDLTRLTLVGWWMMLSTIAIVLGVMVGLGLLLELLGVEMKNSDGSKRPWVMGICLMCGIGAGIGYFNGGRALFNRLGLPLMRSKDS